MTRLNVILLAVLVACALATVRVQHQGRKLYMELQKEEKRERDLEAEWSQLQLEASTLATPARIERLATGSLGMRRPEAARTRIVNLDDAAALTAADSAP